MTTSSDNGKYVLKSVKAIDFYNKNPHLDFNTMNDVFIELIQKVTITSQSSISVNEVKSLLHGINNKIDQLDKSMDNNHQIMKMTYDTLQGQKDYYVDNMQRIMETKDDDTRVLTLIREMHTNLVEKTVYSILQQFPKLNETMTRDIQKIMHVQQHEIIHETQRTFMDAFERQDEVNIDRMISDQYQNVVQKVQDLIYQYFQNHETKVVGKIQETQQLFQVVGKDFQTFLEKQKNSTLKGKESEDKLESCLVKAFPNSDIICQSGLSQCCDYLMKRHEKPDILFENKDYSSNVPHEEIKKFIRDVEYQGKHGVLLSQHSGVTQKHDFQIDIHAGKIMVFVHFVYYDESKVRIAVNLIDHLHQMLDQHGGNNSLTISMEELADVNKEYLSFIGQKKALIETTKKMHKDQLRAIEEFELPKLTQLLNAKFTNVEQLSYTCDICHSFVAKNKRALVTHKNKCRKKLMNLNNVVVHQSVHEHMDTNQHSE
jgi:hypothetical protein